ncbi:MAG: hypothetical protein JSS81_20770 [Acidobacteria bacterium]|nr:hypothetical protein [Acidobacteriota bacterium]
MGNTKHEKTFVDFDKPYEQNLIGLSGIIWFGVGLFLLIVITFGLMWVLLARMEENAKDTIDKKSPVSLSEREKLPPEPRLQAAPGFGVDGPNGPINLELKAPQAEYRELHKQWEDLWANGQKDPKTNTVIALPIEEAKKKLLEENPKARGAADAQKALDEAGSFVSYSSAGRTRTDKRR